MTLLTKSAIKNLPYSAIISSPIGKLGIKTDDQFLYCVDFVPEEHSLISAQNKIAKKTVDQLNIYFNFDFERADFIFDLPLALKQGSEFQQKVWRRLLEIPAGRVKHYGVLVKEINSHARAIGSACRTNLFPVIIPCHRVLDQKNQLRGYKGSNSSQELHIKAWLLSHEKFKLPSR